MRCCKYLLEVEAWNIDCTVILSTKLFLSSPFNLLFLKWSSMFSFIIIAPCILFAKVIHVLFGPVKCQIKVFLENLNIHMLFCSVFHSTFVYIHSIHFTETQILWKILFGGTVATIVRRHCLKLTNVSLHCFSRHVWQPVRRRLFSLISQQVSFARDFAQHISHHLITYWQCVKEKCLTYRQNMTIHMQAPSSNAQMFS